MILTKNKQTKIFSWFTLKAYFTCLRVFEHLFDTWLTLFHKFKFYSLLCYIFHKKIVSYPFKIIFNIMNNNANILFSSYLSDK